MELLDNGAQILYVWNCLIMAHRAETCRGLSDIKCSVKVKVNVKGQGHPRTGHEGPEGEYRCSSTLSLT